MHSKSPLATLVEAYLNEDVFDFYSNVMAGVDDYVASDREGARELPSEIDRILESHSDSEIEQLLVTHGIGFVGGERGYRAWLQQIADRVRAATTG
ncbi:contact-dependent growth inhibition system immunity protein [Nocardioides sp.]|uniref:contact-dependent growth inhibition system immunity protein n=1 Tax=Nocardioides sp. TaxID=35761 RepID=UPI00378396E2